MDKPSLSINLNKLRRKEIYFYSSTYHTVEAIV